MSNPEINEPSVPWHERITTPFRVLFQEGFLSTWHKHTLFSLVSLSLLAFALVAGVWWFGLREAPGPDDSIADKDSATQSNPSDLAEQLQADEDDWARIQEQGQRQEEIALARYRLLCVRQLADRAKDAIDDCRDEAAEWTEDMKDFETASINWSEPSNQALLGRMDMLLLLDTPDKIAADALLDRHKVLVAPLTQAESSGEAASVSSSLESSVEELASAARDMKELLQRRRAMLASIQNAATTSSEEDIPSFTTALENYHAELAAQQQERIESQLAKARAESEAALLEVEQEAQAALAEAKRKAADIRGQIETDRIASETQRETATLEIEKSKAEQQAAREKLELEFEQDLPRIRHYLSAFITVDNHHPERGLISEELPYPFSYIESKGALIDTDRGRELLCRLANEAGDRPRGAFPDYRYGWSDFSSQQREPVLIGQQLIKKYGLLMVEKKMLLP
jgi:hypothetical protein